MKFNLSAPSQEAVDYQIQPDFFIALTKCIKEIREDGRQMTSAVASQHRLKDVISKYLGVKTIISAFPSGSPNAWVIIPDINRNSIMMGKRNSLLGSKDGLHVLKDKEWSMAHVDRKNGKLSGAYAEIPIEITITWGLLDSKCTDEEIAAIVLHEIGHVFSYYETLHLTLLNNLMLANACEEIIGHKDSMYRVKVIKSLQDKKVISKEVDADKLAGAKEDDKIYATLVSDAQREVCNRNEATLYNYTMFEQSADQFAVRMGAGKHLASALNKIAPDSEAKWAYWKMNFFFVINVLAFPTIFLGPLNFIMGLMIYASMLAIGHALYTSPYDKGKDRLERIRREYIGILKKSDLPKSAMEQVLRDLDEIAEEVKKQENRSYFGEYIFKIPDQLLNRASSKKAREQVLESLVYNDLFIIGNQLKLQGK